MIRPIPMLWLSALAVGCNEVPDVSGACRTMCEDATELYGACLEEWGMEWSDAGFDDESAHQESCEVWSWESSELFGAGRVNALCDERGALLHNGQCSDYTSIDWNEEL